MLTRTRTSIMTLVTALVVLATPGSARAEWTIVATYPVPEGASGLAFDGTWLYCGIYGPDGSDVYRIDPESGVATFLFAGPQEDAYGLTFDGQHLWTTDHPGSSSTPAVAMQLDWDGTLIDQFDLPAHYVSGIASDGDAFWVSRYYPDPGRLYKLDDSGTVLDELDGPDDQPWDLCLENGNVWIADYWGDTLYKIDPRTGSVLESHASEGVDPAGIVWDGRFLWYCDNGEGFDNDMLYKVDLQGGGAAAITLLDDAHDFGTVTVGEVATWDMLVENDGTAPLEISQIDFGGTSELSSPAAFPFVIAAGGSAPLPIQFAPSGFGPLDVAATIVSNDPVHPEVAVTLTGTGVEPGPALALDDEMHDFGPVRLNAQTRWFLQIANHGSEAVVIDAVAFDQASFFADPTLELPIEVPPLETFALGVWFTPSVVEPVEGTLSISSNDASSSPATVMLSGSGDDSPRPIGATLWNDEIEESFDNSPKAMAAIADVSGDGRGDVIVCSEDDFVRCYNGNAHGTGDVLWSHEIPGGAVFGQSGLQIRPDVDGDGHEDVVVGAAWAGRLIRTLSGASGVELWTRTTDEYGDGGWVYQVNCTKDYDGDGVLDVLAATGDDAADTGPKRVYCLNGLTGESIWERGLGGPVFGVIGVDDFNGDGVPDVVAGASNESETQGRAVGIDGATGIVAWSFFVDGSSVWALSQLEDITGDGVRDVVVGDFLYGVVHGLDAASGNEQYASGGLGILTRFERLDDLDGDGHPDVIGTHSSDFARVLSGRTGEALWTTPLADNASTAARIDDVSGDGVGDVVVGTLFTGNVAYFLDGVDGSVLHAEPYGAPVDAITAIPDVTGDGSWEMVIGGRDGLVTCISGGLAVDVEPADINGDGVVNVDDLVLLLLAWGVNPGDPADIDGSGVVDVDDLILLLLAWS